MKREFDGNAEGESGWLRPVLAFVICCAVGFLTTQRFQASIPSIEGEGPVSSLRGLIEGPGGASIEEEVVREKRVREVPKSVNEEEGATTEELIAIASKTDLKTVSEDGWVTPGMVELLGLSNRERDAVQQIFDDRRARRTEGLRARLVVTSDRVVEPPAIKKSQVRRVVEFRIPAAEASNASYGDELKRRLKAAAGERAAAVLLNFAGMMNTVDFSRHDVEGKLTITGSTIAAADISISRNGHTITTASGDAGSMQEFLGDTLGMFGDDAGW